MDAVKKNWKWGFMEIENLSHLFYQRENTLKKLVQQFDVQNSKPISTPLTEHFKLSAALSPQAENKAKSIMFPMLELMGGSCMPWYALDLTLHSL